MLAIIKYANLALSFFLELCMLVALGYWGFQSKAFIAKVALGIGIPLLTIIIWGCFFAPQAKWPLQDPWHLLGELCIFGLAAVALFISGQRTLSVTFALIVIGNFILAYLWGQA
jgi:Protein of unknown function (DUF2568)